MEDQEDLVLRSLAKSSPFASYRCKIQLKNDVVSSFEYIHASQKFRKLCFALPDKDLNESLTSLQLTDDSMYSCHIHKDDLPFFVKTLQKCGEDGQFDVDYCVNTNEYEEYEERHFLKDIGQILKEQSFENEIVFEGIVIDITAEKRKYFIVEEDRDFHKFVVENVPGVLNIATVEEKIKFGPRLKEFSESFLRWSDDELKQFCESPKTCVHENDCIISRPKMLLRGSLKDGDVISTSCRLKAKDESGQTYWTSVLKTDRICDIPAKGRIKGWTKGKQVFVGIVNEGDTLPDSNEIDKHASASIFETCSGVVWRINPVVGDKLIHSYISNSVSEQFGYSPEELMYMHNVDDWVHIIPDVKEIWNPGSVADMHKMALEYKGDHYGRITLKYDIIKKNGELIHCESRCILVTTTDKNGEKKLSFLQGICFDVTAETQAKEQLQDALIKIQDIRENLEVRVKQRTAELEVTTEKMQVAMRAKTDFLACMSHEVRTPCVSIVGLTDLLLESALADPYRKYVELIKASTVFLSVILDDVLDLSRIEKKETHLEIAPFRMDQCAHSASAMLRPKIISSNLQFECILASELSHLVFGDETRILQMMVNLLSNARKFTREGTITLKVEVENMRKYDPQTLGTKLVLDDSVTEEYGAPTHISDVHVMVIDTGIGILPSQADAIFEPFKQVHNKWKLDDDREPGTGLGLSICLQLTQLMNGKIWVESSGVPGEGSVFHIKIPLAMTAFPIPSSKPANSLRVLDTAMPPLPSLLPDLPTRQPRVRHHSYSSPCILEASLPTTPERKPAILVVEDNKMCQIVIKTSLNHLKCEYDVVSDGADAVQAVQKKHYDLIFMDIQMPKMNGLEATRQIRGMDLKKQPTICGLSAHVTKDRQNDGTEAGMDDYLCKPIQLDDLRHYMDVYNIKFAENVDLDSKT